MVVYTVLRRNSDYKTGTISTLEREFQMGKPILSEKDKRIPILNGKVPVGSLVENVDGLSIETTDSSLNNYLQTDVWKDRLEKDRLELQE